MKGRRAWRLRAGRGQPQELVSCLPHGWQRLPFALWGAVTGGWTVLTWDVWVRGDGLTYCNTILALKSHFVTCLSVYLFVFHCSFGFQCWVALMKYFWEFFQLQEILTVKFIKKCLLKYFQLPFKCKIFIFKSVFKYPCLVLVIILWICPSMILKRNSSEVSLGSTCVIYFFL